MADGRACCSPDVETGDSVAPRAAPSLRVCPPPLGSEAPDLRKGRVVTSGPDAAPAGQPTEPDLHRPRRPSARDRVVLAALRPQPPEGKVGRILADTWSRFFGGRGRARGASGASACPALPSSPHFADRSLTAPAGLQLCQHRDRSERPVGRHWALGVGLRSLDFLWTTPRLWLHTGLPNGRDRLPGSHDPPLAGSAHTPPPG